MTRKISMGKRVIACACSVVMAGALVPAVAGAADTAADETVLTVVATQVDASNNPTGIVRTIKYTASELQEMTDGATYNYLYSGKSGVTKVTTSSVVSFSSLLNDVSINVTTATASVKAGDGAGKYTFTYEDLTQPKSYFPKYENNSESKIDTTGAVEVPSGIALSAKKGTIESGAVASDVTAEEDAIVPMSVLGCAKDGSGLAYGSSFWTGITEVDFTYQAPALTIYKQSKANPGDPELVKEFDADTLKYMAEENDDQVYYQYSGKGGATKLDVAAGNYVTFSQLFGGLEDCWKSDSTFSVGAGADMNVKYTYTYADVTSKGYFFPNYVSGSTELDKGGAADVPAGIALSYKKGTIPNGAAANDEDQITLEEAAGNVVVMGARADATSLLAGNRFWQNIDTIIITYKDNNTLKVSPTTKSFKLAKVKKAKKTFNIKATNAQGAVTYSVTKAAKKAGVSVSKAGKVTIKKGTKKGTYKVTVTAAGNDEYSAASKTVKVKVVK